VKKIILFLAIATAAIADDSPAPQASPSPAPTLRETVDSLDESQIQKAIEALEKNYLSPESLDAASRQRALLEGLLTRLGTGASLDQSQAANAKPVPFLAEILDGRIGYIRPGALVPTALEQTDAALWQLRRKIHPRRDPRPARHPSGHRIRHSSRLCPAVLSERENSFHDRKTQCQAGTHRHCRPRLRFSRAFWSY
jgi:hypothetical protein